MKMKVINSYADALAALLDGAIGVIPTDTVYGVVCRAQDEAAVRRLYALKARERKPGPVVASNTDQLKELGVHADHLALAQQFWPGPVSVILEHDREYLHQGLGDQPFRIPKDHDLQVLLEQTGPLLTTSANQPGEPPAATLAEAQAYFGDQVDFCLDGGDRSDRRPSSIIRFARDGSIDVVRGSLDQQMPHEA